jgi:hypothetical protein
MAEVITHNDANGQSNTARAEIERLSWLGGITQPDTPMVFGALAEHQLTAGIEFRPFLTFI